MAFEWLQNFASGLPIIGSGVSSTREEEATEEQKKLLAMLESQYGGYEGDSKEILSQLATQAKGGLTAEDKAALAEAYDQAGRFAKEQQGAVQQDADFRSGGVGSGNASVLRAMAGQDAATRLNKADLQRAAMASERARDARSEFLRQRMAAAGMLAGGKQGYTDFLGQVDASKKAAVSNAINTGAQVYAASQGVPPLRVKQQAVQTAAHEAIHAADAPVSATAAALPTPSVPALRQAQPLQPINPDPLSTETTDAQRRVIIPQY